MPVTRRAFLSLLPIIFVVSFFHYRCNGNRDSGDQPYPENIGSYHPYRQAARIERGVEYAEKVLRRYTVEKDKCEYPENPGRDQPKAFLQRQAENTAQNQIKSQNDKRFGQKYSQDERQ